MDNHACRANVNIAAAKEYTVEYECDFKRLIHIVFHRGPKPALIFLSENSGERVLCTRYMES